MSDSTSKGTAVKIGISAVAVIAAGISLYFYYSGPTEADNAKAIQASMQQPKPEAKASKGDKPQQRYVPESDKFEREGGGIKAPGAGGG